MSYIFDGFNWDLSDPTSIPNLLFQHLIITGISLAIGLLIAVPVGVLAARYTKIYLPAITLAGILYTLPSLAFMALLIPFTGLNPPTVIIPLVLYTQVVLIRNIVAAIRAVDPALLEVGRAMGMTERQVLFRVSFPLALPVIVAGLRVAAVTTIGIATIGPLFGVPDLGYLIFQGFNFRINVQIEAGVILVSALAVGVDLLLLALQSFLSRGRQVVAVA
ncbi:MAG TPA: ABC transporter permease [Ktedonobacterales bacterium]|nr:ABC transporter permease [Ktedonobacterales bacterium]